MKTLHLSIIAILSIIVLINTNSVFAAELGQLYVPPASLGNRTANFFIDVTPSVEKSVNYIHLRLFEPSNNQTFQHVTFLLNITKQNQTLLNNMFHSHSGLLSIKLISNDTVGNWTVIGEQEPILGAWIPKDGKLEINSSLHKGLYHFEITIVTIDNDKNIFLPQDAPKFDSWWTIDDNGNIFRNDQLNQKHTPSIILESPLKQFKSGIKAQNVKCDQDLQLVIKSEDGSPACVKPEHLTRLSQYGWIILNLKIIGDTDITKNGLSESNCGQFHTIPENKSNSNEIPVLILKQNSTGCAKITFTVLSLFNNTNDCVGCNSQMVKTAEFLSIGKYNFSRHGDLISGSSGKDYTNSFQIASVPKTVDVSKYPIGSNFTAIFIIKPLPNATGFYDYSFVKPVCNAYPLAVGYSSDQVNSSDFSEDLGFMQNHPCHYGPYGYSQIQVSGIDYVQMKFD